MDQLVMQRQALKAIHDLLGQFVRGEIEPADFVPAYGALFAPFDPPDLTLAGLCDAERAELELFIQLMGGWFGEEDALIPKRSDWEYGKDTEPFGWIDGPAYRKWILEATQRIGIRL
jgi:hypothetical protein